MQVTYRPISDHTVFTSTTSEESKFNATYDAALVLLDRELRMLGAKSVIVEIDLDASQIRADGQPYARAKSRSRGARVVFETRDGVPISFATNRFVRGPASYWKDGKRHERMPEDWQHNLYAIARGLESLRTVERYGIADLGQQYSGWLAIEATPAGLGPEAARDIIASVAGWDRADVAADPHAGWRAARAAAHPDRHGGERRYWDQIEAAGKALGLL